MSLAALFFRGSRSAIVRSRRTLDRVAIYLEWREALGDGHELNGVDVDMGGLRCRPVHRLRDVSGLQRLHASVDGPRLPLVTPEPDDGELCAPNHAGLDAGDPHAGPVQVAAQVQAE